MPRDGSGNFVLTAGNPVVTNTVISSSGWANPTLADIAAALTQSLSKDGQTTPTADLTMGNFKVRNLANAIARTDAVSAGQIQDGALITLGSVAGTDTITATTAPGITAYTAGQQFRFVSAGANTTTTVTININALGAKAVTKNGSAALSIGDIPSAGAIVTVTYDGTQFQITGITPLGGYLGTQIVLSSQTVNPGTYSGLKARMWRVRGSSGGAGGAGAAATGASTISVGTGGQSGAYCEFWMIAASTSATVGAAGAAGAAGASGGNGGSSSFGALATLPGGAGGVVAGPATPPFLQPTLSATGAPTGSATFVVAKSGSLIGTPALALSTSAFLSGYGGSNDLGNGGNGTNGGSGVSGSGHGAGGAGAANAVSSAATVGGAGLNGEWIVDEFA